MPRRPTSADVATEAGVSRTTVSFVLNGRADVKIPEPTRRRVFEAAERLGYEPHGPARQLVGGRADVIALVLLQTPEQIAADAVLAETLRGVAVAARSAGFRILLEPLSPGSDTSYAGLLKSQHADGIIVSGPRRDDPQLERLVRDHFPIVIQGSLPELDVASVDVDNVAAARGAVEHLITIGHRRIACITNAPLVYTAAQDRLDGYREALAAAGIEYDPALVETGDFDAASGHRAMTALLAQTSFGAAFVASDVLALGAIGALREAGLRVPEDVSVVGFDDIQLAAYFDPPLTTVRLPAFELGQAAGRALLERISYVVPARRTVLPTELIVRDSAAPAGRDGIRGVVRPSGRRAPKQEET